MRRLMSGFVLMLPVASVLALGSSSTLSSMSMRSSAGFSLEVVHAYAEVLRHQSITQLAEENVATHQSLIASIQSQYTEPSQAAKELARIKGHLALARTTLMATKGRLQWASENFQRLTSHATPNLTVRDFPEGAAPINLAPAAVLHRFTQEGQYGGLSQQFHLLQSIGGLMHSKRVQVPVSTTP